MHTPVRESAHTDSLRRAPTPFIPTSSYARDDEDDDQPRNVTRSMAITVQRQDNQSIIRRLILSTEILPTSCSLLNPQTLQRLDLPVRGQLLLCAILYRPLRETYMRCLPTNHF